MHDSYIKGIQLALIIYDLSRYKSFLSIPQYMALLAKENVNIPIFIVGSKKNLIPASKLKFYEDEWTRMAALLTNTNQHIVGHHFVSSKTFEGIDQLFQDCELQIKNTLEILKPVEIAYKN